MLEYLRNSHDGAMTVQWLDAAENNEDQERLGNDSSQVIENMKVDSDTRAAS